MFNLNECDKTCFACIKAYKKKHRLSGIEEHPFEISCRGIPKKYINPDLESLLTEEESTSARVILDPVSWAAEVLDWHCIDPDGEIWKRKNPEEYYSWLRANPDTPILGRSRYHRPYQKEMLECTSQYKAFRIGRRAGKSETLVVSILYHIFTKPGIPENEGFKVIVIAPYQNQVDLVFKRIEELIHVSPSTSNAISRNVKSPSYKIELYNGSVVKGYTAGTKSGGNADSVRGSDAHMLVFDECDYLSPKDIDSALSVTIDHPDASVWMSSTPKGTREKFFEICHSRLYREFHFSSYVSPMWTPKTEKYFRENLTEIGYKHEIEAEWGTRAEGVFQNLYVDRAKKDYEYGQLKRDPYWIYTIGVDWNDVKNGTMIVIAGFNPNDGHTHIMHRDRISRDGWTQLAACQKIADLNRFWRPEAIYIDSGYGSTQHEILRGYGFQAMIDKTRGPGHPDSKLKDIVKAYQFGGKVDIYDLITKEPISKPAKPFLVENAVRRFETGTIHFPKSDVILEKQLLSYMIDRVTTTGVPVYKPSDDNVGDHVLDALMLALVALTLEKSQFGKPVASLDFAFTGKLGEVIDKDPNEALLVVKKRKEKDRSMPAMNRTEIIEGKDKPLVQSAQMPGAHLNSNAGSVKLWAWPGFMHDAPPPSRQESFRNVAKTLRPKRKNI